MLLTIELHIKLNRTNCEGNHLKFKGLTYLIFNFFVMNWTFFLLQTHQMIEINCSFEKKHLILNLFIK